MAFVSVRDGFDLSTASGRLHMQIIAAMSEYERALITERVVAGQVAARRRGAVFGRPRTGVDAARVRKLRQSGATWEKVAAVLGVPRSVCQRAI
ncbi:MAG: recombinase family protein [Acidobacteria bacterium]|nr:recombinase family protein [Acidobacteriota bacterium]